MSCTMRLVALALLMALLMAASLAIVWSKLAMSSYTWEPSTLYRGPCWKLNPKYDFVFDVQQTIVWTIMAVVSSLCFVASLAPPKNDVSAMLCALARQHAAPLIGVWSVRCYFLCAVLANCGHTVSFGIMLLTGVCGLTDTATLVNAVGITWMMFTSMATNIGLQYFFSLKADAIESAMAHAKNACSLRWLSCARRAAITVEAFLQLYCASLHIFWGLRFFIWGTWKKPDWLYEEISNSLLVILAFDTLFGVVCIRTLYLARKKLDKADHKQVHMTEFEAKFYGDLKDKSCASIRRDLLAACLALGSNVFQYLSCYIMWASNGWERWPLKAKVGLGWANIVMWSTCWCLSSVFNDISLAILVGLNKGRLSESSAGNTVALKLLAADTQSFEDPRLQKRVEQWLNDAKIKWVKVGYLRNLLNDESKAVFPRCQEIGKDDCVVGADSLNTKGTIHCRDHFVVSHPWLAKEHPDPCGDQLRSLVDELDREEAHDDDLVFYDFISCPQHGKKGRTDEEKVQFKMQLENMSMLYSLGRFPVIVLPEVPTISFDQTEGLTKVRTLKHMAFDELQPNSTPYMQRGWCFVEFTLSYAFNNIRAIAGDSPLKDCEEIMAASTSIGGFEQELDKKTFTNKGDRDSVTKMLRDLFSFGNKHRCQLPDVFLQSLDGIAKGKSCCCRRKPSRVANCSKSAQKVTKPKWSAVMPM